MAESEFDKKIDKWVETINKHKGEETVPWLSPYPVNDANFYGQQGLEWITPATIRHYCAALGDRNPLFWNEEYAKKTRWGGTIAPPTFTDAIALSWVTDREPPPVSWTFPRNPGGVKRELFQPIRPGDKIRLVDKWLGYEERKPKEPRPSLDGIVTALPVHAGENVVPGIQNSPGSLLYQVSDLSTITAEIKVDETEIVNVKLGQPAEVTIDAFRNKTFKGRVTEIGQSAVGRTSGLTSGQSSTTTEEAKDFKVVVTLDEPPPGLRPGLSTTAKITTATRQDAVTIPIQALAIRMRRDLEEAEKDAKGKGTKKAVQAATQPAPASSPSKEKDKGKEEVQGVFVLKNGRAVFTPVETGIMGPTDMEVLSGVKPGDEIVTGSFSVLRTLKNNTKVKVDNSAVKAGGPGT